jgi:hypothetical protein
MMPAMSGCEQGVSINAEVEKKTKNQGADPR